MNFWELLEPPGSDYRHMQVSGKLAHPFHLPAAECEACGQHVSTLDTVLPYECPTTLRQHPLLTDHDAVVSLKEFRKLEKQFMAEFGIRNLREPKLTPGACLQPAVLNVPAVPKADFLWSNLWSGLSSIVVSGRVHQVFLAQAKAAVALCPVTLGKVGKASASSAPRIPRSGEPEDMMDTYPARETAGIGPYYQLLVIAQSGYPPGTEPGPSCPSCGEALEQDWKAENSMARQRSRRQQEAWDKLTTKDLEAAWNGDAIFRLAGRGSVLVANPLKVQLEEMGATNLSFREFPAPPPPTLPKSRAARLRKLKALRKAGAR